jgi:predicted DCC family thiol-disulfide oxidoreductase YuxK
VTTVPFQRPGTPESFGLTYAQCEQSSWAVTPGGATYGYAQGMYLLLAVLLNGPWPLWFYAIPGIRQLQERGYRWVATNRSRLPGARPHCEQFPADCGTPGAGESAKPVTTV